jgi:hypothetical protein
MSGVHPEDPNGDMVPILRASIEYVKCLQRHPSGKGASTVIEPIIDEAVPERVVLTAADRCDSCGARTYFRVMMRMDTPDIAQPTLDFCAHHFRKNFPAMATKGWAVIAGNPDEPWG